VRLIVAECKLLKANHEIIGRLG